MKISSRLAAFLMFSLFALFFNTRHASPAASQDRVQAESRNASRAAATIGSESFYMARNGRDHWSRRLAAPNAAKTDGPFASLGRAGDAVRALAAGDLKAPVTVWIRDGEYPLHEPLTFGASDSGTAAFPIVYAAYRNERPVISGGTVVANWKPASNGNWTAPGQVNRFVACG